jgi:hypothetical protein
MGFSDGPGMAALSYRLQGTTSVGLSATSSRVRCHRRAFYDDAFRLRAR